MTFNEQRAHDLALHFVDEILDAKMKSTIQEQLSQGVNTINAGRDVYKEYSDLYKSFLDALNRDFPESE